MGQIIPFEDMEVVIGQIAQRCLVMGWLIVMGKSNRSQIGSRGEKCPIRRWDEWM